MKIIKKKTTGLLLFCLMALALYPKAPVQAAYAGILGYEENLKRDQKQRNLFLAGRKSLGSHDPKKQQAGGTGEYRPVCGTLKKKLSKE